jgi:anti-sigma factor RsiW
VNHCDDIVPLLSAFNDGELSPLESDQVARHLDNCEGCKETLVDFMLLGHHLRSAVAMPPLDGFTDHVMAAIGGGRRPFFDRLRLSLEDLRERWLASLAMAAAATAIAALALVLSARLLRISPAPVLSPSEQVAQSEPQNPTQPAEVPESSSSETVVSRLEATPPSVAMWSEPDYKTTVIWLGDDKSGND